MRKSLLLILLLSGAYAMAQETSIDEFTPQELAVVEAIKAKNAEQQPPMQAPKTQISEDANGDIKLSELGTEINNVKVGSMLGLFEKDGVWYTDSEFTQKATGMHAILADSTIGTLSGDIAGIKMGRVLGLYYNESDGKWYQDEKFTTLADGMQLAFADIALGEFDTNALKGAVNKLTVSDLFINADSGILALIDENTTVQELPDALLNGVKTMNIEKALDLGVLTIDVGVQAKLDVRMPGWKAMNLTEFFNKLIELALMVP